MKTYLVTGGSGFIGSNFIRFLLHKNADFRVVNLDKLTYAGNPANLHDIERDDRYTFVHGDICDAEVVGELFRNRKPDVVINFAAESFVDRSILDANPFLVSNIRGTYTILDIVKNQNKKLIHISTDEVFGSLENENADENFKFNTETDNQLNFALKLLNG